MVDKIRWGILGTGNIAHQFARGLKELTDAELIAVGSRRPDHAASFATEFNVPRVHVGYEALAKDEHVDVVYVGTPHPMHAENAVLCLENGRHVLCEKPFTVNHKEAVEVVNTAKKHNRFLMEGMWTRFLPATQQVISWLHEGQIGEVRQLQANFGFRSAVEPDSRLYSLEMAGGSLLDVGVYTVSMASLVFGGPPASMTSAVSMGETGVDEQAAMLFQYKNGAIAALSSAIRVNLHHDIFIMGTEGIIQLHSPFWCSTAATLHIHGQEAHRIDLPIEGNGFNYEAKAVGDCIRKGFTESSVMPLAESLEIMQTLDEIRAQWGLKYSME